jgi:hypothetical protein
VFRILNHRGGREEVPMKYSEERREAILRKLLPPENRSVAEVAAEEGISSPRMPSLLCGIPPRAWLSMSADFTQNEEGPKNI